MQEWSAFHRDRHESKKSCILYSPKQLKAPLGTKQLTANSCIEKDYNNNSQRCGHGANHRSERPRGSKSRLLVGRRPPTCVPNALLDSCVLPFAMLLARVPKCAHLLSLDPCLRGGPRPTNSSAAPPWDSSGSPEILAETRAAVSRMQSHAGRGQVLAAKRKRPVRDQLKKARQRVNWSTRTLEWVGKFLGPQGRRITRLL